MANNIQDQVLVAANTNIVAVFPPSLGDFLVVFLRHDNTANQRAITWSAEFMLAPTGIDEITANSINVFTFHGKDDGGITKWFLVGQPILGAL